jgi:hypothetical protein
MAQIPASDSSVKRIQEFDQIDLPTNYREQYKIALRKIRKVYPLALHAAKVIDSLEREIETVDKKRKKKKVARKTHRSLKNDFKFLLKELYVSEGVILTKLIYRETGMTVEEIIQKYKGNFQASVYNGMASLFDQRLDAKYHPEKEDFILECVIRDIKAGKVNFDPSFKIVGRDHFKKDRKEYLEMRRETRREQRRQRREDRKERREERRK